MIPAAAYIRVSSEMQVETGASLPSQLAAIENYAQQNGYYVPEEFIFRDEAFSARSADRPEFQRMISLAKKDKPPFTAIICYENSRFARSREDAIVYKTLLRKRGIKLLFTKQEFDDSPMGRLMEGIIEIVDEWYSANLAVETRRGQEQNAKDGYSTGGRPPYGLRRAEVKNEHGAEKARWEPDPETSKIVQDIYHLYICGMGYKAIAAKLNREGLPSPSGGTWNANTLHYILHKNQDAYLGRQIYGRMKSHNNVNRRDTNKENWVIKEAAWEPIITEKMAKEAADKAIKKGSYRRAVTDDNTPRYLLTGRVFCGECSSAMSGSSAKGHFYYRCNKHCASGKTVCSLPVIPVRDLENTVVEAIKKELSDKKKLKKFYEDYKQSQKKQEPHSDREVKNIEAAIERKLGEKNRLISLLMKGTIEEADAKPFLSQIATDVQILEGQLSELQKTMNSAFEFESFSEFYEMVKLALTLPSSNQNLIDAFVQRVDVLRDDIHITLTIDAPAPVQMQQKNDAKSVVGLYKVGVKDSTTTLYKQIPAVTLHLRTKLIRKKR